MKAHKTQIKIDGSETSLMLFALEQLRPDLMGPKQKEAQARLIKRLLKADLRIQDQQGMLPWDNPRGL